MPEETAGVIRTPRLLLVPASLESLEAELVSRDALGDVLGLDVPESWPPELYDADAVRWTIGWVQANPGQSSWRMYYVALVGREPGSRSRLIGVVGYKGAPNEAGIVEIGYGVVPEQRRRGYAREAVGGLVARAFADPRVRSVVAHTLPELTASIGVLQTSGFVLDGPGDDPHEPSAIRFLLTRGAYEASPATPRTHLTKTPSVSQPDERR